MDLASTPSHSQLLTRSDDTDMIIERTDLSHGANGTHLNGIIEPSAPKSHSDLDEPLTTPSASHREDSVPSSDVLEPTLARRLCLPTGCCYDDRMKLHANADFSASPHHPEDPRRIEWIMRAFKRAGLVCTGTEAELALTLKENPTKWMYRIAARAATMSEICTMHTAAHFYWVQNLSQMTSGELRTLTENMDGDRKSLYVGSLTFEAALISAGGAIETCKHVVIGNVKNAIAIIRPPGHHAEHNESLGFCIFNNVPIAAKICMRDYPEKCRKVLILDWDVHHGNGIQNMFYEDPNVLYISIHVYQDGVFYPGTPDDPNIPDGGIDKVGIGLGAGTNVNIGWHDDGMGDAEYMAAFQKIVMPMALEFGPDLVIVSAGFDAAAGDSLGGCFVTPACYAHMTHMLMSLAGGKVAVCLEGGYNLQAISASALAVAKTLMGEPPEKIGDIQDINRGAKHVLDQVKHHHAPYWRCMRPGVVPVEDVGDSVRLHDAVRGYQARILRKHRMIPLVVQRDGIAGVFEDQVLATPSVFTARRIVIIFHDPPDLLAQPDPQTNRMSTHNTYLTDPIPSLVSALVMQGNAVIDISVPPIPFPPPPHPPTSTLYIQNSTSANSYYTASLEALSTFIYDNYILTSPSHPVIALIGIGEAFTAVRSLLLARPESRSRIAGILAFIAGTLRPVKSEVDEGLSGWYKDHSLIYVGKDHACWGDGDMVKRVGKKRFGRVVMGRVGGEHGVGRLVGEYLKEGSNWVGEKLRGFVAEVEDDETEDEVVF